MSSNWSPTSPTTLVSPTSFASPTTLVDESAISRSNIRVDLTNESSEPRPWDLPTGEAPGKSHKHDWWFASTALPLLAATLGPLANVLSIAAIVTYWREDLVVDGKSVSDFDGVPFRDPLWCYWLNIASLILGIAGNAFLLFNFTQRVRYIIALPMTILLWYLATGVLIAITVCMNQYTPPIRPHQTYTQGFWYAIMAAVLYLVCSMGLMVNMLGYFLGHYHQKFTLTDPQRTLILQTMLFFTWLAGGGAAFSRIETDAGNSGWGFVDALYFCEVTILTVGFGDLAPSNNFSRGLIFPYSVGGIVMLYLVIASINKSVRELGEDKVVKKHVEKQRIRTMDRTEAMNSTNRESTAHQTVERHSTIKRTVQSIRTAVGREQEPKILLLREEKDRFDTMRHIQQQTSNFRRWWALCASVTAFTIVWCVGAVVFWQAEKISQGMTYFQALYFCYVSLLAVGYGDLAPKTNAGRSFFVVWSLIAVPTMTILISDMADTVISKFNRGTFTLADFTVLPKEGIWLTFLERRPRLLFWLQRKVEEHAAKKRVKDGFQVGPTQDGTNDAPTMESLAAEVEADVAGKAPNEDELAQKLALAIRKVSKDIRLEKPKRYCYEEWVEFTRLIRFTSQSADVAEKEEEEDGLVDWDWIGEDSPMMSGMTESEFVLDRLCESLSRYMKRRTGSATRSFDQST